MTNFISESIYTPTYILTWNPKKFHWDDYSEICSFVNKGHTLPFNWSCRSKSPKKGNRFILLMQGMGRNNGIIATGTFMSEPYIINNTRFGQSFADIELKQMWDYSKDEYIHTVKLKELFSEQCWVPQMSGIRIKSTILPELWGLIKTPHP